MVERKPIGVSDIERLVQLVKGSRDGSNAGHTSPAGNKVLEGTENVFWGGYDRFGVPKDFTIRDVAGELEDAQGRIDDAKGELEDTQVRLEDAENAVGQVGGRLDTVETETIPNAVTALEQADAAARGELDELDTRLSDIDAVGTGELASIRDALSAAQDAVESAQTTAREANTAANAASQAALEAAGIAASKGRVIVSETEPTGDDRQPANIWIKPVADDPDTEIEEKAVTYVYLEASDEWQPTTSSELAQAAQNALDAREAAQQAQQRADTAISNAATAQSAAEAAQRTADEATTDAREAHNEAVAAAERAEAKIAAADNMILNGDFERGPEGWSLSREAEVVSSDSARRGALVARVVKDGGGISILQQEDRVPVSPGEVWRLSAWVRYVGDLPDGYAYVMAIDDSGSGATVFRLGAVSSATLDWSSEWQEMSADYVVPEGVSSIRLSLRVHGSVGAGPVIEFDNATVKNVTDILAAEQAAKDAQARADEAYTEAASKATPAEVTAAADAAEAAAKTAAALDAQAKADQAKADALSGAAVTAQEKADAAKAQAIAAASTDAATKASQALQDALDALSDARGEITAEITASANGKNSITRSTSAASGTGTVKGDLWVQVDASGDGFAQWYWDGSAWKPSQIKSDMLEALDVHKLQVTGSALMDEAVIDKLWVDGIAAKSATFNRVTVANGDLMPDFAAAVEVGDTGYWSAFGINSGDPSYWVNGADNASRYVEYWIDVKAGTKYRSTIDVKASTPGSNFYVDLRAEAEDPNFTSTTGEATGSYIMSRVSTGGTGFTTFESTWEPTIDARVRVQIYPNHTNGADNTGGYMWFKDLSIRPMAGAVLIEDGAITTPKLTVTESMSAAIVDAMSVNAKKLVVSDEAILNKTTLIGQTVVDDINVQGKLIGSNGVFTGTVDFANVNVTGTQLVNKLGANSIEANKIKGGTFEGKSFTGGDFEGAVIVGGAIATNRFPSSEGGIHLATSTGLRGWDSKGNLTFRLRSDTGEVSIAAPFKAMNSQNRGVILFPTTTAGGGGLWFTDDGTGSSSAASIWRSNYDPNSAEPLNIRGANGGHVNVQGGLRVTRGGLISEVSVTSYGDIYGDGTLTVRRPGSASGSANAQYQSGTGQLRMITSSRRYKKNIADWNPEASRVLALQPRQWQHSDPAEPENIDERWYVGFIAEEVDELGLKGLVRYEGDGKGGWRPEALNYDRFAAAQQVVLQKHEQEIQDLRSENDELRSRLDRLEAILTQENA